MDFFFLYNALFYLYWYVYFLLRMRVVRCVTRQYFVSRNSRAKSKNVPQCRDRRSRLETPPSLPQGEECLTTTYLDGSFYPKGCHNVGTDALVCPLQHSTLHYKQLPLCGQTRASVPTVKQTLQSTRGTYCNSKFKVHNSKL